MSLVIVSLADLMRELDDETVRDMLKEFKTLPDFRTGDTHDVEKFLTQNAIQFQKMGWAATHLIYSSYKEKNVLVGYFAVSNKHLTLNSRTYNSLSSKMKSRFQKIGYRPQSSDGNNSKMDLIIPSFLIGQLGINYSEEAKKTKSINGYNLVALAEEKLKDAVATISGKYIWLECLPSEKLLDFYVRCGYTPVAEYEDRDNGLCLFVKKIF